MKKIQNDIELIDFMGTWLDGKKPLHCGTLSERKLKRYLKHLYKIKNIPQDSCIESIEACFFNSGKIAIPQTEQHDLQYLYNSLHLDLRYKPEQECKCKREDCLKNIEAGNCTDPFMIKHVCKKFFAEKYKNKQR